MAHRGRLNVLAHTIGMPYEYILREFEGERTIDAVAADPEGGTGDVKYHLAAHGTRTTSNGKVGVRLVANPSHLEAVNPVVEGRTRAEQTDRSTTQRRARPVGRAAGAAARRRRVRRPGHRRRDVQPARARGLLDRRHAAPDHEQPDRLHDRPERGPLDALLVRPREGLRRARSSTSTPTIPRRRSPPSRLAMAYRRRFGQDVVIDLVGYRRFGHNEQDEAAYTQPLMVEQINAHPQRARALRGAADRRGRAHAGRGGRASSPRSSRCCAPRTTG